MSHPSDASPLAGRTIAVTRAESQLAEARHLFERAGATVVDLPALVVTPPQSWGPLDDALEELDSFHWLVFSSGNGVEAVEQRLRRRGQSLAHRPASLKLAAVGRKTASQLEALGAPADFVPPSFVAVYVPPGKQRPTLGRAELATRYDPDLLCEAFIEGEEVTCPVLGEGPHARALPVVRIAAPAGAYDYQNKYFTDTVKYHCPSGLPAAEEAAIQALSLAAYRSLGCRGWGRADVMIRASDRQAFLLEMNTSPGMTDHSLVPMSAKAAGISYPELCLHILQTARLDSQRGGRTP
jgi:hypothetical protein